MHRGPLTPQEAGRKGAAAKRYNYHHWRINRDDPEPLIDWLIRKGYKYIVFRKSDLKALRCSSE